MRVAAGVVVVVAVDDGKAIEVAVLSGSEVKEGMGDRGIGVGDSVREELVFRKAPAPSGFAGSAGGLGFPTPVDLKPVTMKIMSNVSSFSKRIVTS